MKIILIGNSHPSSIETMYFNGFKMINKKVILFDPIKKLRRALGNKLNFFLFNFFLFNFFKLRIYNFLKKKKNILLIIFKGEYLDKKFIKLLKNKINNLVIININTDNPFFDNNLLNKKIINTIPSYDYYFTWSKAVQKKILFGKYLTENKVFYLPFGFDSSFRNSRYLKKKSNDRILFYGSWDSKREKVLMNLSKFKIDIYGNGWNNASASFKNKFNIFYKDIYAQELAKKIPKYTCCLNFNRPQVMDDHNMRFFEVTGFGGILLSSFTKDQSSFFKEGEVFYFRSISELKKKLIYIKNNSFYFNIKKIVFEKSKINTYQNRCRYILQSIKLKKE